MSQKSGQDQGRMRIRDVVFITIAILGPSWTTAYITESVVYVIPMLASWPDRPGPMASRARQGSSIPGQIARKLDNYPDMSPSR